MDKTRLGRIGSVAAGVAGGAVVGALLFAPLSSLAQDEGGESPEPDATTQEDGTRGDRPFMDGRGPGGHGMMLGRGLDTAADALGVTDAELRSALEEGMSIADVAEDQGVDVQEVVDALVAAATERLDQAVEDGRLEEDRAEEIKAALPQRVAAMVEREGLPGRGGRGPEGVGPGGGMGPGECHEDDGADDSDAFDRSDGSTENSSSTTGGPETTAGVQYGGTVLLAV
ncbi:MAG TPA: hypothetical protein VK908_01000 [Jiangellales bacterium]|nr:hypothetical protein [Jiangellales bacterium]